ncbi:hypothetical protein BV20DRAFT_1045743 [Pilatotrama ljubarskyi]|nr:hypothetical protein BV20DRAFT_1045743 [Pilatotrama ljubarskyi]
MPRTRGAVKPPAGGPGPVPAPAPDRADPSASMAPKRPPIRRAASAAPALPPTPPRTTHKRKRRSRSRVTDSSSEEEDEHEVPVVDSDGEDERASSEPQRKVGALVIGHKKRRTLTLDAIAEELSEATAEDAFWLGNGAGSSSANGGQSQPRHKVVKNRAPTRARSRTRSPSASPAPHLLRRGHTGLFSPPPSRRAPTIVPRPATPPPEPKERKQKGKATALPERDSPNNPFLVGDSPASVPLSEDLSSPEPRTPKKHVEKPTITYVFRGVKTLLANPHYRSPEAAAEVAELEARARLPVEHPDFSPTEACEPTLLFPEARKQANARRRARAAIPEPSSPTPHTSKRRARADSSSDEEHGVNPNVTGKGKAPAAAPAAAGPSAVPEVEDAEVLSAALAERVAKRMRKGIYADGEAPRTRPSSTAGDSDLPRLPEKDRSDPMKRAMGPVRPA